MGAGSAGCVLANRLSESGKYKVLLLEAGGNDKRFWVQVPIGCGRTFFDPNVNWKYQTQADPGINNRSSYWPRGKVLGGSSSINSMVYIEGQQEDFNQWAHWGNPGWDWSGVAPYFDKLRKHLHIQDIQDQAHPICDTFINAGIELGIPKNQDFNADHQEGVGHYQITTKNGIRMSAARAYLDPVRGRNNLQVITHALASRVNFQGIKATGLSYIRHGKTFYAKANKEIILSAGSINSPQLLQLSGIGEHKHLQGLGIDVVVDNKNVGNHLQDHIDFDCAYRCHVPTLNNELHNWYGKIMVGMKYLLTRTGPLALSVNQAGGFFKTRRELDRPNMQLFFWPLSYLKTPKSNKKRPLLNPDSFPGFSLGVQPLQPTSRGYLSIQSKDPMIHPEIYPNYLSTEHDIQQMLDGARFIDKFARTRCMSEIIDRQVSPDCRFENDDELLNCIRSHANTVFHPCGTCRMGEDAEENVVDSKLKVHGAEHLRVVDASVFPGVTSGNTNAPTIMVAEKAADIIRTEA